MYPSPPFRLLPALLAAGLLSGSSLTPPAPAQDDVQTGGDAADPFVADAAKLIPADAGVVVRIADPDAAMMNLTAFVRTAAPQHANKMLMARGLLGTVVKNPTMSGVNLKTPWYIVGVPQEGLPPATVFLMPAANVQAMQEAVGPGMAFKTIGTYAAYTDAGEEVLEGFGEGGAFVDSLPAGSQEIAKNHDITLAINVPRLMEVYGEVLKAGVEQAKQQSAQRAGGPDAAASQGRAIDAMMTLFEKSGSTVVGFKATPDALSFKKTATFDPSSDIAAALKGQTTAGFDALDKLPEALDGYIALEGNFKPLLTLLQGVLDEEEAEAGQDLISGLIDAGLKATAGGFVVGPSDAPLAGVQVSAMQDVAAAKPAVEQYLTAANGMERNGVQTVIEDAGTVDVGGITMRKIVTDLEVVERSSEAEQAVRAYRMIFGESGQTQMIGYTEASVIQITGGGEEFAEEAIAHLGGQSGHTNEPLDALREKLPKRGNIFAAIDLASVVQSGLAIAVEKGAFPPFFEPEQIRSVAIESSYAAVVVRVEGDAVIAEGVLPAAQVRNLVDFAEALQGAQEF